MIINTFSGSEFPVPELKVVHMYGFPAFTLTFASEEALQQAEASGGIASFRQTIQDLYGHAGSKRNSFDEKRAIHATYIGRKHSWE